MKEYTCKCGKMISWGTDGPATCRVCPECGTAAGGGAPQPHRWIKRYHQETGKPYRHCTICGCREDMTQE